MKERSSKYLQKQHPRAIVASHDIPLTNLATQEVEKILHGHLAIEPDIGVKYRLLAVPELGGFGETASIAQNIDTIFAEMLSVEMNISNNINPTRSSINTAKLPLSPKVRLYTDTLKVSAEQIINEFEHFGLQVEVIEESNMYKSIFISYGGPDEEAVSRLNSNLKSHGIPTWFFPDDSIPGQKLHRMMHEGVNQHDKVLLICSEASLTRAGVLNEIERVLEREAKEGGTDILIPVTLDNFVFNEWNPERPDIAEQLRSRVIINANPDGESYKKQIDKLISALRA
ncbi:toll/interleukin-1 receptor domain-containing protein [Moritella sp. F3]|uniref:toll/interleukin-1 receptor domain-containing protein n=1 Tax=Moritella sp. F3 TaxID=2718882 RepID=UPI0018E13D92|nr:toll/interleukin-1 receptor domain-containing protein [Moritella sp. F3]GIC75611.1 hypothetical protein FMO001_03380 [Moritella sp. F1]GIC80756.1 hypothetical protein FMO003_10370 [Moritella sp. F3]